MRLSSLEVFVWRNCSGISIGWEERSNEKASVSSVKLSCQSLPYSN